MAVGTRVREGWDWRETATGAVVSGTIRADLPGLPMGVYTGLKDAVSGDEVAYARVGEFEFPILSTDTPAKGDKLYWDSTNNRLTVTATANIYAGVAATAKASGVAKINILLNQGAFV